MKWKINEIPKDLIYNYISIGITAVCGAAFSIIISFFYTEDVLGRFNTIYSYYIVLSQFCVCGIHMAVVRYAAEENGSKASVCLLARAIRICIVTSVSVCVTAAMIINILLYNIIGASMSQSFHTIWAALIFFSINKVFLGWLNGNSMMSAYAFFQAARNFMIAFCLIVFAIIKMPGEKLTYCFFVAEAVLFVLEIGYFLLKIGFVKADESNATYRDLLWFGVRILPSNAVLELNTKIDVICLSILLRNESLVGIYSFAAMFAEGFYQLFVVIRKMMNPKLTKNHMEHCLKGFIADFKSKYLMWIYGSSAFGMGCLLCGFYILTLLIGKPGYHVGLLPLAVICLCMVMNAKSIVFGNILAQTGNPAEESMVNVITTICNGILNVIFIKQFGIIGAAVATGFSYFIYSFAQRYFVKRRISILL